MQVSYLNGQQLFLHDNAKVDSGKKTEEFQEENNSDISASELEVEFEKTAKILPNTLNVTCGDRSSRCRHKSCPCGDELKLPGTVNCFNVNRSLIQWHFVAGEHLDCITLNLFFKPTSLSTTPFNLRLSKFILKDMINERKTGNIMGLDGFLSERSLIDSTSNIVPSNLGWLKSDQLAENAKVKALLKRSLHVQLGVVDDLVTQLRSMLINPLRRRSPESSSFPWIGKTIFHKSKSEMTPVGKYNSSINFSETKHISYPGVDSLSSCYFTAPIDISTSKGWLRCLQNHGMTYLCFSAVDNPEVVYVAIPQKIESNAGKDMDCMYLFYFIDGKSSDSRKHSLKTTNLIAKMKVSSSIVVKPNRMKTMETEFVLYASQELPDKPLKSYSIDSGRKDFSRKVIETFRPSNMKKNKLTNMVVSANLDGLHDIKESALRNYAIGGLFPNHELAAVIVEERLDYSSKNLMVDGWGLKFLEKASSCDASLDPISPQYCCKNIPYNGEDSACRMNVIIPAGFHGGPVNQVGGPASLIDRWRSGGSCDCGGWDVGCPLRTLNYISIGSNASTMETENDNKSVKIFMEGTKNGGHPAISMVNMTEDLYSIYFHSSLSPLQSFAVAVASIHARIPGLLTKL